MKIYNVISGLAPDNITEYGFFINRENAEKKLKEITPNLYHKVIDIALFRQESLMDYDPRIVEIETED
jgi:hypothetical protein